MALDMSYGTDAFKDRRISTVKERWSRKNRIPTVTTREMDPQIDEIVKGPYRVREIPTTSSSIPATPWMTLELESRWLVLSNAVTWLLWSVYILAERNLVSAAQRLSGTTLWQAWLIILAEVAVMFPESVISAEVVLSFLLGTKKDERKRYRLEGDAVSSVDVCIACCGESVSTIIDTLVAAASQDYPASRYRVFVLDDSKNEVLCEQVSIIAGKTQARKGPLITYLARKKTPGVRHYFKAGNVRHGLETSAELVSGSELFAALDADMIVAPDWLRRLVPHVILHEKVALACPPQHFYNIPSEDPLAQDSYMFARIGPFERSLGRRIMHGIRLMWAKSAGWQVVFVKEEVQFGIAPETFSAYIKQRMRWVSCQIILLVPTGGTAGV
ncbi:MAG: hypothetical protein Q9221_006333 [Calogaya cf. arnoldii]